MNWSKLLFCVGIVLCLPLRVFLVLKNVDPETGFYLSSGFTVSFYTTLLLAALVIIVGYGLFRMEPTGFTVKRPKLLSIISLLTGGMVLVHSADSFWKFIQEVLSWHDVIGYLMDSKFMALGNLLFLFVGLGAAAAFFSLAIGYWGGNHLQKTGSLLMPALWSMIYCGKQFISYPQIADMSDRVLWFLAISFFTLLLIGQARVIRGVNPQKGVRYITAFGYGAALTGITLGVSQIVTLQKISTLPANQWRLALCFGIYGLLLATSCRAVGEGE